MTVNEFKAWLEGFSESFTKTIPNKKQWEKIQERLSSVSGTECNHWNTRTWWPTWYVYNTPKSNDMITDIRWTANTTSLDSTQAALEIGKQEGINLN